MLTNNAVYVKKIVQIAQVRQNVWNVIQNMTQILETVLIVMRMTISSLKMVFVFLVMLAIVQNVQVYRPAKIVKNRIN